MGVLSIANMIPILVWSMISLFSLELGNSDVNVKHCKKFTYELPTTIVDWLKPGTVEILFVTNFLSSWGDGATLWAVFSFWKFQTKDNAMEIN